MGRSTRRLLLALACVVGVAPAVAAQSYDSSGGTFGTGNPLTYTVNTTSATNQAGCAVVFAALTPSGVTLGVNTFTQTGGTLSVSGFNGTLWCGVCPSNAANTVSVSYPSAPGTNFSAAACYSGVNSAIDALNSGVHAGATSFDTPTTTNSVAANTIAVGFMINGWDRMTATRQNINGGGVTTSTLRAGAGNGGQGGVDIEDTNTTIGAAGTSFSMGGTQSLTPPAWGGFAVTFAPTGAAGARPRPHAH
jgi:hypothetical protein